jgi:hypothetical protein
MQEAPPSQHLPWFLMLSQPDQGRRIVRGLSMPSGKLGGLCLERDSLSTASAIFRYSSTGQGLSLKAIARTIGVERKTVRRWLRAGQAPTWRHADRGTSILDPYQAYLEERWQAGCRNAAALWRELKAQGFSGQLGVVRGWATRRRRQDPPAAPTPAWPDRRHAWRLAQRRIEPAFVIAWSVWRRCHQAEAQKAHLKRKLQL